MGRTIDKEIIWELILTAQARDGILRSFLFLPVFLFMKTEGGRKGGHGKAEGLEKHSYAQGKAIDLHLQKRKAAKARTGQLLCR